MHAWLAPRFFGLRKYLFGPSFMAPLESVLSPLGLSEKCMHLAIFSTAVPMFSIAILGVIMCPKRGSRRRRFHLCLEHDISQYGSPVHSAVLDRETVAAERRIAQHACRTFLNPSTVAEVSPLFPACRI
jgi:hypothetical protein